MLSLLFLSSNNHQSPHFKTKSTPSNRHTLLFKIPPKSPRFAHPILTCKPRKQSQFNNDKLSSILSICRPFCSFSVTKSIANVQSNLFIIFPLSLSFNPTQQSTTIGPKPAQRTTIANTIVSYSYIITTHVHTMHTHSDHRIRVSKFSYDAISHTPTTFSTLTQTNARQSIPILRAL